MCIYVRRDWRRRLVVPSSSTKALHVKSTCALITAVLSMFATKLGSFPSIRKHVVFISLSEVQTVLNGASPLVDASC